MTWWAILFLLLVPVLWIWGVIEAWREAHQGSETDAE